MFAYWIVQLHTWDLYKIEVDLFNHLYLYIAQASEKVH